jgi:hypothetical protein
MEFLKKLKKTNLVTLPPTQLAACVFCDFSFCKKALGFLAPLAGKGLNTKTFSNLTIYKKIET